MLYLDTSLLVAAFTPEAATDRALDFLSRSREQRLVISEWVNTEFAAALSGKIRTNAIDEAYRVKALALFEKLTMEGMEFVPVTTAHFREAARLASGHKIGLRAGDALHLAIARSQNANLCTLDKQLAAAGDALGIPTRLI